ncbi:MAG: FKBP-type peptidyl-prolyl cis-trans isomerase [Dysgonamonadaceae bacterium]|jgi:FKBP-type peptidyl-prolyl cis-trans isomerase SlyD|nr:FKBP-type peptidyl-prolyl cis-trans isomerase [Dysgonamonadaceae bacterium]
MKISEDKTVSVTYNLTVDTEDGGLELMERATEERPLTFIFGYGMMLEAFERNLEGLAVGDRFSFTLEPEEAYGVYFPENVAELQKKMFEIDGKFDGERVKEGETLPMMDAQGRRMMGSVIEIKQDVVVMDFNHPLAGETLHFDGQVTEVHPVTQEELAEIQKGGSCSCGCGCEKSKCGDDCSDKCK